ncbi:uncharacterized protein LOC131956783 [Physella acuta]|uniref:uncharacterized protein LOC131956783 n=1 Tax=Physella acuta TaxID=109671 RepID=UPI0027DD040B|nr:uncharacterized protein LOC131956783 [Physella acuta]
MADLPTVSSSVPVDYPPQSLPDKPLSSAGPDNPSNDRGHGFWYLGNSAPKHYRRDTLAYPTGVTISEQDSETDVETAMSVETDIPTADVEIDGVTIVPFKRSVSLLDSISMPSGFPQTRPRIHIQLMRARSISQLTVSQYDQTSLSLADDTASTIEDLPSLSASNPDVSIKRSGYLKKIKTLFRPKSMKNVSNLSASNENINSTSNIIAGKNIRRVRSVSQSSSKNILSETKSRNSESPVSSIEKSVKFEPDTSARLSTARGKNKPAHGKEKDSDDEAEDVISRCGTKLERSYSLVRSDSRDRNTVNFTRIPSMRRRHCVLELLHHFTTSYPPDDMQETHVIKEATHIQPLEGGESVVTDILSNKIVLFDARGFPKVTFAVEPGSEPWATCVTPDGALAVTLKRQGCVSLWSTSGEPIREFGQNELSAPTGIQCDALGRFVVADEEANTVCIFNKQGALVTELFAPLVATKENQVPTNSPFVATFFNQPRYICVTKEGNYVIADSANHSVKIFDQSMNFTRQFGQFGRCDGQFKFPYGVASDEAGNLYVADHYNNRVSLFTKKGEFVEHLLTSQDGVTRPSSIGVLNSRLYVTHGGLRANKISVYRLKKTPTEATIG